MGENSKNSTASLLGDQGVKFIAPETIHISQDIDPNRISGKDVIIHPGCRISGSRTLIHDGAVLGAEVPVTVENCQIGPGVQLKGGYFKDAVFLKGASMGSGAHVREGTILEEGASGAHTVGLKQTILFPFVTLGSLINFCDCLMAGGTSRKDHSEVGSSYIHFNYTPNQDKATPSLMGDVPHGVMLDQRPIFLGGQGGLVGPCRLAFGTVVAAGTIQRKDELRPGRLLFGGGGRGGSVPYTPGGYSGVNRILRNNLFYIANLRALMAWYTHIRTLFVGPDLPEPLFIALKETLDRTIEERIKRLKAFVFAMEEGGPADLSDRWPALEARLREDPSGPGVDDLRDPFLETANGAAAEFGKAYVPAIQSLEGDRAASGSRWLQAVVDRVVSACGDLLPDLDDPSGKGKGA